MSLIATRILTALGNEKTCQAIYDEVRHAFPGVGPLCAATQSKLLQRVDAFAGGEWYPWCLDLYRELRKKGWLHGHNVKAAAGGDLIFTVDGNHNGSPDHVYTFIRWEDEKKLLALVYDNYQPQPHLRNVGAPCTYKGKHYSNGRAVDLWRPPV